MLEIIMAILGSGSLGSIIGLVGGLLNRKVDLEAERLKFKDKQDERDFELKRQDGERIHMQAEYGMRLQVADKEIEGKEVDANKEIEIAGYTAMGKSYEFAVPTPTDGWIDKASKIVRPLLTLLSVCFTAYVFVTVDTLLRNLGVTPDPATILKTWVLIIEWVVFQTGVIVGWWFAMRPGRPSKAG